MCVYSFKVMKKSARTFLKPNPFISLRDPETGKWCVIFRLPRERRQNLSQGDASEHKMPSQVEYSS